MSGIELDLATPFAIVRANWNAYCDQLQGIGVYGGCTPDCYNEDEQWDECNGNDIGWSRGRHTERDRSRKHDRRSRAW